MAVNSVVPHFSWPGEKEENNEKCQSQYPVSGSQTWHVSCR